MNKTFTRLIALVMSIIMCISLCCTVVSAVGADGVVINKTAGAMDGNDQTTVTLNVGGEKSNLSVDIIYILGAFISSIDEVEKNVMISCLKTTIGEIVAEGTTVNFGIVPYSSTAEPIMPLTAFSSAQDMESFTAKIYDAIQRADDIYDGINMENALTTAKEMFAGSALASHPERQHLVMVSSGQTYFFNSGDNNEYIATVPVRLIDRFGVDSKALFAYPQKIWQRARLNETNSYPIPYHIVEEYTKNPDKYNSLWDCYWYYIDAWAKADVAAGDTVVYETTTRADGDFISRCILGGGFQYHSDQSHFKYSGNGAIIAGVAEDELEGYVTIDLGDPTAKHGEYGPNPLVVEEAAHAIGNERAMWEAYNYIKENIEGAGINFYPIYQQLRDDGSLNNGYFYKYTDQFVGHSFMNMLAGGTAVAFSADKTFFDPIKSQIKGSVEAGSYVEDYIGYDAIKGNFEFIDETSAIKLTRGGVTYTTNKLETAKAGATSSYAFTAPGQSVPTFWLDYYYGNGTDAEKFQWTFGESASLYAPAQLTYKLQLIDRTEEEGVCTVETNIKATLYPKGGEAKGFPVPEVTYTVGTPVHTLGSIVVTKNTTGAATPVNTVFQLQKRSGNEWVNVGEAVAYSAFDQNKYTFAELEEGTYRVAETGAEVNGYTLQTVYSEDVVLAKTTADNGDTSVGNGGIEVTNTYTENDTPVYTPDPTETTKNTTAATTPTAEQEQAHSVTETGAEVVGNTEPTGHSEDAAPTEDTAGATAPTAEVKDTYGVAETGAEVDGNTEPTGSSEDAAPAATTADNSDTSTDNDSDMTTQMEDDDFSEPPKTGDTFRPGLWVITMVFSAAMLAALLFAQKKCKTN